MEAGARVRGCTGVQVRRCGGAGSRVWARRQIRVYADALARKVVGKRGRVFAEQRAR